MLFKDSYGTKGVKTGLELIRDALYSSSYDGDLERMAGDIDAIRDVVMNMVEMLTEQQQEVIIQRASSSRWKRVE